MSFDRQATWSLSATATRGLIFCSSSFKLADWNSPSTAHQQTGHSTLYPRGSSLSTDPPGTGNYICTAINTNALVLIFYPVEWNT